MSKIIYGDRAGRVVVGFSSLPPSSAETCIVIEWAFVYNTLQKGDKKKRSRCMRKIVQRIVANSKMYLSPGLNNLNLDLSQPSFSLKLEGHFVTNSVDLIQQLTANLEEYFEVIDRVVIEEREEEKEEEDSPVITLPVKRKLEF